MSRISLKSYGLRAAALVWRRKLLWIVLSFAFGAALAVMSMIATDPPSNIGVIAAMIAPLAALAAIVAAGGALKLHSLVSSLRSTIDAQERVIANYALELEKVAARQKDILFVMEERTNTISRDLGRYRKLTEKLGSKSEKNAASTAKLAERAHETTKTVSAVLAQLRKMEKAASVSEANALAQFKKIDDRLASKARADKVDEAINHLDGAVRTVTQRVRGHHVHDRFLTDDDIKQLQRDWAAPFGLDPSDANLHYIASRIRLIEGACAGRLATAAQTMIARLLAIQSIKKEHVDILEIGVLFGVASACFHKIGAEFGQSVHLTLLDPFEGYYDRGAGDLITGVSVSRAIFERNMDACGIPKSDYAVIQRLSDNPEAIKEAATRRFDALLIDGDHTYEGVKKDFENFHSLVRKGGVILFDDYGVNEWPDIKRFVDEIPSADMGLTLAAKGFRTAAFKVN